MHDGQTVSCWMEGFAKAAADLGLTAEDARELLVVSQRMTLAAKQGDAFTEGFNQVAEKDAVLGALALGGALGAGVLAGGQKLLRNYRSSHVPGDPGALQNMRLGDIQKLQARIKSTQGALKGLGLGDKSKANGGTPDRSAWRSPYGSPGMPKRYYSPRGYNYY